MFGAEQSLQVQHVVGGVAHSLLLSLDRGVGAIIIPFCLVDLPVEVAAVSLELVY